ncbi:MAG: dihydrodipicolinate synthase family protein, partial [Calditrichota bacterium]
TTLPVILYNVPGRTASNLLPETVLRLAEIENIIAIKEASGDLGQIMEILQHRPEHFYVLSGDDALTLPTLLAGGDGVISVISNQIPTEFSQMVQAALSGDLHQARSIHYKFLDLMNINFIESNPVPVKAALAAMGKIHSNVRLPLVPLQTNSFDKIIILLRQLNLMENRQTA